MDKKAIKTFAIESRKKLIEEVKYQAGLLGITTNGIAEPVEKAEGMEVYDIGASTGHQIYDAEIEQRKNLVKRINEKGFDNVVEEVAYTWFNRIIAIRFMEVNDYLPNRIRVLSSEKKDKTEPDLVFEAPHVDLNFSDEEIEQIYKLKNENEHDELFKLLFIKQCNKLNEILPELFEKTADYTELLLSIDFTNEDGVVRQLVDNISEDDFTDQVEIIGWLYQYYNTELKEETFKQLKKGVKISKERIPAATQLFTPDWIVKYMVENSLGRLWLEGHPDSDLKENWKYYLDEAEQEPEVQIEIAKIKEDSKNIRPEDIKIIDPAIGSGHIIIRAFDILMQIYTSVGYTERDAAVSILENNLCGLDIDDRAYQLAFFAVMMKARAYNRNILKKAVKPQIYSIQESNRITDELIDFVADGDANIEKNLKYLVEIFTDAKNYGSIIDVDQIDFNSILDSLNKVSNTKFQDFKSIKHQEEVINNIYPILKQAIILSEKYDVVVTNPPYMGNRSMNKILLNYLKKNFPYSKNDTFAVFIEKCQSMVSENRYLAMITQQSFMFLISYEKLRMKVLEKNIVNMAHLGARAFEEIGGEVVQTTTFVLRNNLINDYQSKYVSLVDYNSQQAKEIAFLEQNDIYVSKQESFIKIPGIPIAYWVNQRIYDIFNNSKKIKDIVDYSGSFHKTANNNKYLRFFWEIKFDELDEKWKHYNKGGSFRKWYGNNELVVNWSEEATDFYAKHPTANLFKREFWNKKGITWTALTSALFNARYFEKGYICDFKGASIYPKYNQNYVLGYVNSIVFGTFIDLLAPTIDFNIGQVVNVPYIDFESKEVDLIVQENISISKKNWDSYETSFNFEYHPFIELNENDNSIKSIFNKLEKISQENFIKLKNNEEQLNQIFIDIYGLKNELKKEVVEKNVSFKKSDINKDTQSFISYAVGCMLGRYSLDEEGLIYAGGQWDPSKYSKFIPDYDNITPILDTEYFEDDIVGRFVEFVKVTFGEETLEENLDFIAKALKRRGQTSREIIRNYFLTDFYKDHVKTYKKHPIYWQFDSGKNNGFKALIYMHRYEPDLVARVRTDYLHKTQKALETAIANNERIIENSASASQKSKAVKIKNKLLKQLEETRKYDEALAHIANQKIPIDLDDGVKVNYAKFQGVEVSREGKKAKKVDLLKKI